MKRPIKEEYFDYKPTPDGDIKVPDSEAYYEDLEEYADHLDQEIERLKAERVELVKFCMKVKKNWTIVTDLKAIEIIAQFNKEKS